MMHDDLWKFSVPYGEILMHACWEHNSVCPVNRACRLLAVLGKERRSSSPRESSTHVIADAGGLRADEEILIRVIELQFSI